EKQELTPVKLLTTMITPEIDARISGGAIRFAVNGSGPDNPASLREVAVAKALPGNRQLAIFVPGNRKGLPYRVFMVDDSLDAFPMGSTLGINLSPAAFEFRIGEHIKALGPGKTAVIPPARKVNDRGQVSVIISVARAESGWRPVSQTRWLAGNDKRDVAIAFLHPKSGQGMVNCYQDNPPWLERR